MWECVDGTALVSTIVPAYNAEGTIGATLRSALAQSYPSHEVTVVDDGSVDRTAEVVNAIAAGDRRVRLVQHAGNRGLPAARNTGIEHAKGSIIALLDADDLWHPTKISKQVEALENAGPRVGLIYTYCRYIDHADRILWSRIPLPFRGSFYADLLLEQMTPPSTTIFSRVAVDDVGAYDEARRDGCEDWDLLLRVAERYECDFVPEFLTGYRVRADGLSKNQRKMIPAAVDVLKTARRRRPDVPARLFRSSQSAWYWHGARNSLLAGDYAIGLAFLARTVSSDPALLFDRSAYRRMMQACRDVLGRLAGASAPDVDGRSFHDVAPSDGASLPPQGGALTAARWRSIKAGA